MSELEKKFTRFLQEKMAYKGFNFDSDVQQKKLMQQADEIYEIIHRIQEKFLEDEQQREQLMEKKHSLENELEQQKDELEEMERLLKEDVTYFIQPVLQNILDQFKTHMEEQLKPLKDQIKHFHEQENKWIEMNKTIKEELKEALQVKEGDEKERNSQRYQEIMESIQLLNKNINGLDSGKSTQRSSKIDKEEEKTNETKGIPIQIKEEDQWFYNSLKTPKQVKDMMATHPSMSTKKTKKTRYPNANKAEKTYHSPKVSQDDSQKKNNKEVQQDSSAMSNIPSKQEQTKSNHHHNDSTFVEKEQDTSQNENIQEEPSQHTNESNNEKPSNSLLSFLKKFS